jgi:AraC-like DNA-binding protein
MVGMSDFLLDPAPASGRTAFIARLEALLARAWPRRLTLLAGPHQDHTWQHDPDARLVLVLRGHQRWGWHDGEAARTVVLRAGEAIWVAPGTAVREDWTTPVWFLSLVLRPRFLRLLVGIGIADGQKPSPSTCCHHTQLPLGEPGTLLARALSSPLAVAAGAGAVGTAGASDADAPRADPELLRALVRMMLRHVRTEDAPVPGKAVRTWQRVQEHLAARIHESGLSRPQVARALDLHPSHLSDLCHRFSGGGFVQLVEGMRLERARILLREHPGRSAAAIATSCGFASAGYFGRIFRRATGLPPGRWRGGRDQPPVAGQGAGADAGQR